jgi:hypothetical protein
VTFGDYGCCVSAINANDGGYDWQYVTRATIVFACDERAGYDYKGKQLCALWKCWQAIFRLLLMKINAW